MAKRKLELVKDVDQRVVDQILFRNSEKTSWQACRQAWYWGYELRLKPNREKSPLFFGSMAHEALEGWYPPGKKRGIHPAETFDRLWKEWLKGGGEEVMVGELDAGTLGVKMMENYVDEFGDDEWMEVIAPEMTFQVDVFHPKSGRYLYTAVGTMDGAIRDLRNMKIGILEHKTGASLEPFGAPLPLDEQNGSYWTFAPFQLRDMGLIGEDEWPYFLLYNRLRKDPGSERPKNEDGLFLNKPSKASLVDACEEEFLDSQGTIEVLTERLLGSGWEEEDIAQLGDISKSQPAPLFRREFVMRSDGDRRSVMQRTNAIAREMRLVREGKLEVYKQPGKHCTYCDFREMCEVHETGSDWTALRDNMYHEWEPYSAHEIALEGRR